MLILENIKLAFGALRANKMRGFLTMLGIIIGIGSVIAIMTVSSSLTTSISVSFQEMGANNITVGLKQSDEEEEVRQNGMRFGVSGRSSTVEEEDRITDEMLEALTARFPDQIEAIAISESVAEGAVRKEDSTANISITGINEDYFASNDITLLAGRKMKKEDLEGNKKVIMVSDKVVENIFDGKYEEALWKEISVEIDGVYASYYIVGIYKYEESSSFSSSSEDEVVTTAYVPLTTGKEQIHADDGYDHFTVVTAAGLSSVSALPRNWKYFFFHITQQTKIMRSLPPQWNP